MLGERHVGLDDVPIIRTVSRAVPAGVRLAGDPQMLHLLASALDIVLDDLGDNEWETRTGAGADTARAMAVRLRDQIVPAANTSWHQLDVTADEFAAVRPALVELAYRTTRIVPAGTS